MKTKNNRSIMCVPIPFGHVAPSRKKKKKNRRLGTTSFVTIRNVEYVRLRSSTAIPMSTTAVQPDVTPMVVLRLRATPMRVA